MVERLAASLDALTAPGNEGRFLLAGSSGRAALLGVEDFPFVARGVERDLDVVDRLSIATDKYVAVQGVAIDAQLTRRLHPLGAASGETTMWGLYDPGTPQDPALAVISEEALGIQEIALPFRPETNMATFGACAHMALHGIGRSQSVNFKHKAQVRAIQRDVHEHSAACACAEWSEALGEYHARMRERHPRGKMESGYLYVRQLAVVAMPGTFHALQYGSFGEVVRRIRGSQPPKGLQVARPVEVAALAPTVG